MFCFHQSNYDEPSSFQSSDKEIPVPRQPLSPMGINFIAHDRNNFSSSYFDWQKQKHQTSGVMRSQNYKKAVNTCTSNLPSYNNNNNNSNTCYNYIHSHYTIQVILQTAYLCSALNFWYLSLRTQSFFCSSSPHKGKGFHRGGRKSKITYFLRLLITSVCFSFFLLEALRYCL